MFVFNLVCALLLCCEYTVPFIDKKINHSMASAILGSSLAKKYWMALTGLFLSIFLVVHLAGNLVLLGGAEMAEDFNAYAKFMTTFPLIKIISYLLYASILFHAIDGFLLTIQNRKARPVKYHYEKPGANSGWSSRNMGFLGTIMLLFIVGHMATFWWRMKFGELPLDAAGNKDIFTVVETYFTTATTAWLHVLLYVISMIAIAFHLWHGFQSAFQSLGINHGRYTPWIRNFGVFFAVVIAWFAILFTGRYPRGIFDYLVGVGRWHNRVACYAYILVTDRYPPFQLSP
jgi:succinate dehydrogenase / fumarate reductase, cytochrome b subunit